MHACCVKRCMYKAKPAIYIVKLTEKHFLGVKNNLTPVLFGKKK